MIMGGLTFFQTRITRLMIETTSDRISKSVIKYLLRTYSEYESGAAS